MKQFARYLGSLILLIASVGCVAPLAVPSPTPAARPTPTPSLTEITTQPARFAGKPIVVTGILESQGTIADVRFFLRDESGARLQVNPWAPLEVAVGPGGGAAPKSMVYFVGRRLRLSGTLENPASGTILNVSLAEEL